MTFAWRHPSYYAELKKKAKEEEEKNKAEDQPITIRRMVLGLDGVFYLSTINNRKHYDKKSNQKTITKKCV